MFSMLTLENGLRVLLISDREDPSTDDINGSSDNKPAAPSDDGANQNRCRSNLIEADEVLSEQMTMQASAAICIYAGALLDPDDLPGLAHYLEHMLFMGSQKFQGANDWDKFVKEIGGGTSNARTDLDCTTFFFDVQSNHLERALEQFSEFFISPLFREDNMESELEILDKEFNEARMRDRNRMEYLVAMTAKPSHPMRNFTWGNIQSLKTDPERNNINVRDRIIEFFNEYYVAQNMSLSVLSNETLETLEEWVTKYYSRIRRSDSVLPDYGAIKEPFNTPEFNRLYKVVPVRNICQLQIAWALPSLMSYYRTRPEAYVAYILGHEGEGSLLSLLHRRHYALDLQAGVRDGIGTDQEHNKAWSCFTILISLTELGFQNIDEVVTCVFECLKMMRDEGPKKEHWLEINAVEKSEFFFMEPDTVNLVGILSQNMWKYQPSDIITAQFVQQLEFNEEHVKMVLDLMTADRINLLVLSQQFANLKCLEEEKWFKTKYVAQDIPCSWQKVWKNVKKSVYLHYPDPNPYIASDFTLHSPPDDMPPKLTQPMLIDDCAELWYYMDETSKVPRAYVNFYLKSVHATSSPKCKAMTEMYSRLLNHVLGETCYPAEVARLPCSIFGLDYGLSIRIYGFTDKMLIFFEAIVTKIKSFCIADKPEEFESVKGELNSMYLNAAANPERLNREFAKSAIRSDYWTTMDTRIALQNVTMDDLAQFVEQFYDGMFVEGLAEGNLPYEDVEAMLTNLQTTLNITCPLEDDLRLTYVTEIPCGNYLYSVKNINPCDEHTVVYNYYQYSGVATPVDCVLNEMLLNYMEEPCFYYLRTKHNLSYNPRSERRAIYNVIGFSITVASSAKTFSAKKIDDCIESFLVNFNQQVQSMTPDQFENFMSTMRASKTFEDSSLKDEVDRHWKEVMRHTYEFDIQQEEFGREKTIASVLLTCACMVLAYIWLGPETYKYRYVLQREILDLVTLDILKEWSASHILPSADRRKLSIQVIGYPDAEETAELYSDECTQFTDDIELVDDASLKKKFTVIKDLKAFRKSSRHFAVSLYSGSSNSATLPPS